MRVSEFKHINIMATGLGEFLRILRQGLEKGEQHSPARGDTQLGEIARARR